MSQKRRGGLTQAREVARPRCVYCGKKTSSPDLTSEPLSRYPHSTRFASIPPLCEASRQGKIAQRSST